MKNRQQAPFGNWYSPITAELVAESLHNISQIQVDEGCVYWVEQFPEQKGRCAIISRDTQGEIKEMTPRDFSVRNRVHEYGGGDYLVKDGVLYYCNDRDQKIYRQERNKVPVAITPESPTPMGWRYADFTLTPDKKFIVCVRERHLHLHQVINDIVAVPVDASFEIKVLAQGDDFYAAPKVSFDGASLLYLRWNHPLMPWDGTELCLASLSTELDVGKPKVIAGGLCESVLQPQFNKAGDIYFVSDKTNWWNLYKYHQNQSQCIVALDAEFAYPAWIFGTKMYDFMEDGRIACIVNEKGRYWLGIIESNNIKKIETQYNEFAPFIAVSGDTLYTIGSNSACAPAVLAVDLKTEKILVIHSSSNLMIDAGFFSMPESIEFPTENDCSAYANFYKPQNPFYVSDMKELPPLIVISHGGPTSCASTALNLKIQYWTSRGYAVIDVNYGGSTGYGRAYRDRLKGNWGVVDVADCVNAAKYLVAQTRVDKNRLIIKGSSAGGLTTLCALVFYDLFKAGASYYGVADLEGIASESHKFESHYLETLIGPYPEAREHYRDRSPLYHSDLVTCPVIFFQGMEDKVVPPSQAEAMIEALQRKKLPYAYVTFAHEQHGFRDSASVKTALESELSFYSQVFGILLPDNIKHVEIQDKTFK